MNSVPRCYGSPFAYEKDNDVCLACGVVSGCAEDATLKLAILRESVIGQAEVRDEEDESALETEQTVQKVKEIKKPSTIIKHAPTDGLSKKGGQLLYIIGKWSADLKSDLLNGRNPFADKTPTYFGFVCDILIQENAISRSDLIDRLVHKFNWSPGTAASHCSIIWSALKHLGFEVSDHGIGIV